MTTMSVPSTLVKCLYLFFDLPHTPEVPAATQTELPLADRRALLQKVFVQVRPYPPRQSTGYQPPRRLLTQSAE